MINVLYRVVLIGLLSFLAINNVLAEKDSPSLNSLISSLLQESNISLKKVESVYGRSILQYAGIEETVKQLDKMSASQSRRQRANAWLIASHLYWRHGQLDAALAAIDKALNIEEFAATTLQKARLLDVSGDPEKAYQWYKKAMPLLDDIEKQKKIRLRMTLMEINTDGPDALVKLAQQQDQAFKNRAAIALAILNYHEEAIKLYKVTAEGSEGFRQQVRFAEWAIRANDLQSAKTQAWQAVERATIRRDRLYALSVLLEAYRMDDALDSLIDRLNQQQDISKEAQQVLVDLLREKERYQEAITLFKRTKDKNLNPELRQQLIKMYREAGQDEAVLAEYKILIENEPDNVSWLVGLSEHYLEKTEKDSAEKVWKDFLARTSDPQVLLSGAQAMAQLGFYDLSVTTTEKAIKQEKYIAAGLFFLFDMYRTRGESIDAEKVLERMDQLLPASASERIDLADAYQRLKKPKKALVIWENLSKHVDELGYDEQMRLAWLYEGLNMHEKALGVWRGLWDDVESSSRRRFVEDRLMMLAAKLGRLGDIAIELEEKLAEGKADKKDSGLLVRLYTRVGDEVSATEVIQEYFNKTGGNQLESLKEQAKVLLMLSDYVGYNHLARKLVELDPENKVDHLRGIILNQVEQDVTRIGKDRTQEMRELLAELREVDKEAVGGEFEAGVFVLAGYKKEAIEAYRRAMAEFPNRSNNYLLMGDLLKRLARKNEAVAIFQYLAESAQQDDLFMVALDGITNMQPSSAVIKWAQRTALERLTSGSDKVYLYNVLADIAEEAGDAKGRLSALENSLAHANSRRSSVLRELITLTAEENEFDSQSESQLPDQERNLAYGRRLIALKEELPPEIYIDLGKVLLEKKDPVNAEKAFSMVNDITGRLNTMQKTAELFDEAGYHTQALEQYERALISDNSNIGVMLKLAQLRENTGQDDASNQLYKNAINTLLMRQPMVIQIAHNAADFESKENVLSLENTVTREYKENYELLLLGFLTTLPTQAEQLKPRLLETHERLMQELKLVINAQKNDPENNQASHLVYYPRLNVYAAFYRRVALATGYYDLADQADSQLLAHFDNDKHLLQSLVSQRVAWGLLRSAESLLSKANLSEDSLKPIKALIVSNKTIEPNELLSAKNYLGSEQAEKSTHIQSFIVAFNVSRLSGNQEQMLSVARDWVKAGFIVEAVKASKAALDAKHYRSLCEYVARLIKNNRTFAENVLFNSDPMLGALKEVEAQTGDPVFSEQQLMQLIRADNDINTLNYAYLVENLSAENRSEAFLYLIPKLIENSKKNSFQSIPAVYRIARILSPVLEKPMGEELAGKLPDMLIPALDDIRSYNSYALLFLASIDIDKSNVDAVQKITDFISEKYKFYNKDIFQINLLRSAGKYREAIAIYMKNYFSPVAMEEFDYGDRGAFERLLLPQKNIVFSELDALESKQGVSRRSLEMRLKLHSANPDFDADDEVEILQRMLTKHPDNQLILARLYSRYNNQDQIHDVIKVLEKLTKVAPDNIQYHNALVASWHKLDNPVRALAANKQKPLGVASDVPAWNMQNIMSMAPTARGNITVVSGWGGFGGFDGPEQEQPQDKYIQQINQSIQAKQFEKARTGLRSLWQIVRKPEPSDPGVVEMSITLSDFFNLSSDGAVGDEEMLFEDMRNFDMDSDAGFADPGFAGMDSESPISPILESIEVDDSNSPIVDKELESDSLLNSIAKYPFSLSELEKYLRSLDIDERLKTHQFYTLLVEAYKVQGKLDEKLTSLAGNIQNNQISKSDFTLWLALLAAKDEKPSQAILNIAKANLTGGNALSEYQLLLFARIYARSGLMQESADIYRSIAVQIMSGEIVDRFAYQQEEVQFLDVNKLIDEVNQYLDEQNRVAVVNTIATLAKPDIADKQMVEVYEKFVMSAWEKTVGVEQALSKVQPFITDINSSNVENLIQLAYLQVRAGQAEQALQSLKMVLQLSHSQPPISQPSRFDIGIRDYITMLGMSNPAGTRRRLDYFNEYARRAPGTVIAKFGRLFPASNNSWTDDKQWLKAAAASVSSWVGQKNIDTDKILQTLSLIALRLQQSGDSETAKQVAKKLMTQFSVLNNFSNQTVILAVEVAKKVNLSADLEILQSLAKNKHLHVKQLADVVHRTSMVDSPQQALAIGKQATEYTLNDALLKQMVAAAKKSGDEVQAQRWAKLKQEASHARKQLEFMSTPKEEGFMQSSVTP